MLAGRRHARLEHFAVRATKTMKPPKVIDVTDVELLTTNYSFVRRQIVCFLHRFDEFNDGPT